MSSEGVKAGETELEMVQRHVRQGTVKANAPLFPNAVSYEAMCLMFYKLAAIDLVLFM